MSKTSDRRCSKCGKPIGAPPYAQAAAGFCCEDCYLKQCAGTDALIEEQAALAAALATALDLREHETGLHSRRVACHTLELARRGGAHSAESLRQIYWGALLHDIGKIGVPDAILLKQGPLSEKEWREMRSHPENGYRIVSQVPGLEEAAKIVLSHEERFDGSGYPQGLRGDAIPWGARLFAVIDTLDAMTSDRPYRIGLEFDAAKAEILCMSGSQFDPAAVELFLAAEPVLREMVAIKCGKALDENLLQPSIQPDR